jgi:aspartyl/asparaginyl-tRNA synthetase
MRQTIRDILKATAPVDQIQAAGWVRTRRDSKAFSFL